VPHGVEIDDRFRTRRVLVGHNSPMLAHPCFEQTSDAMPAPGVGHVTRKVFFRELHP
jgi:hypothetical protein